MRGVRSRFAAALVASSLGVAPACESADTASTAPAPRDWTCTDLGGAECTCKVLPPDTALFGTAVPRCALDCCLLVDEPDEYSSAQCTCRMTSASCEAEAASRPGSRVVTQCPPPAEDTGEVAACAAPGENCSSDYLGSKSLAGCCAGNVCALNDGGVPVCRAGTATELAHLGDCERAARDAASSGLDAVEYSVATSVGTFSLAPGGVLLATTGPGGCLAGVQMELMQAGAACRLTLDAAVVDGRLVPTFVGGSFEDCAGYGGTTGGGHFYEMGPAATPFEVSFEGAGCDGRLSFESYCVAGTFDWHLRGAVGPVTFADQHLHVTGSVCMTDMTDACPAP